MQNCMHSQTAALAFFVLSVHFKYAVAPLKLNGVLFQFYFSFIVVRLLFVRRFLRCVGLVKVLSPVV